MKYYHLNAVELAVKNLTFYHLAKIKFGNNNNHTRIYEEIVFNDINQFKNVVVLYNLYLKIGKGDKVYYYMVSNRLIHEILLRRST